MTETEKLRIEGNLMQQNSEQKVDITSIPEFQSRVITSLRFPLIVMIIMFHLYEPGAVIDNSTALHYVLAKILGADGIAKIAVPAFFLISGFLFFLNVNNWEKQVYVSKLKSRSKTLLLPYILWNALPILLIVILNITIAAIQGNPLFGRSKEFLDSIGWFNAFWSGSDGHPYVVPLWYVRDLMVCCLLTPLIYRVLKSKLGVVYLMALGICYLCDIWFDAPGLCVRAIFFFSAGAYFSIRKINMVRILYNVKTPIYIIALVLLLTTTFMSDLFENYHLLACNIFIIFGIWSLFNIATYINANLTFKTPLILTESVFFIFAFHVFPLPGIGSVLAGTKSTLGRIPISDAILSDLIEIIVSPILIVMICVVTYFVISRIAPSLSNVLVGSRNHNK